MKPKIKVEDLAKALQGIETDRQLTKEIVEDALKEALTKAYRKHIEIPDAYVRVDIVDGTIHIYHERMVVEEVEDDELEIELEEAQKELDFIYGNKKVGNKMIDPIQSLYIWGTYQLLQNTHLKSTKEKVPTRPQAYLIESYLRAIELIDTDNVTTDANNIRSRLHSFLKKYDTVEALLDYKTFKLSPYNIGRTKLW